MVFPLPKALVKSLAKNLFWKFRPENWSKPVRKRSSKPQKNLPEAPPEYLEIANKPVSAPVARPGCLFERVEAGGKTKSVNFIDVGQLLLWVCRACGGAPAPRGSFKRIWIVHAMYNPMNGLIKKQIKKLIWPFLGLDSGFSRFPAGSRQDFWRRIRICGQICWILASRRQNLGKPT